MGRPLSTPDLNKIIALSKVFGVSTDYLLNDEIETVEGSTIPEEEAFKTVSMETANAYIKDTKDYAKKIGFGVFLCILSAAPLVLFPTLAEKNLLPISAAAANAICLVFLLVIVAIAVGIFIKSSLDMDKYEYIEKEYTLLDYGVEGMVKKERENYKPTFNTKLVAGIILCILSAVPVIVSSFFENSGEIFVIASVSLLLCMVAIGVYFIISSAVVWDVFKQLLNEEEYSQKGLEQEKLNGKVASIFWPLATVVYLGWSFITNNWGFTWIVWPIAGILFVVIIGIVQILNSKR